MDGSTRSTASFYDDRDDGDTVGNTSRRRWRRVNTPPPVLVSCSGGSIDQNPQIGYWPFITTELLKSPSRRLRSAC